MTRILSLMFCLVSATAFAVPRQTQVLEAPAFDGLTPARMNPGALYYNEKLVMFGDWQSQSPQEGQVLNLYPGFVEPEVTQILNNKPVKQLEHLMMYVVRTKLVLNKAPAIINLDKLRQIDEIKKFDPEIKQQVIQPAQIMANVIGKGQISNFDWCGNYITRPKRELELSFIMPKTRGWCTDTAHSVCVESCYEFTPGYKAGVALANLKRTDVSRKIDNGIGFQSEIRTYKTESEAGLPVALNALTKISTPVRGVLDQSIFYFNQIFEYGKVFAVVQDDPADPTKSIVTAYFVFGVKKSAWDLSGEVGEILQGKSSMFNTATGITAGIPNFTQAMLKSIANIVEN